MCQKHRSVFCFSLIVLLLAVALAACQNDVPDAVVAVVTNTPAATSTAQPTFTATPTFTLSPTPTQMETAVSTHTPTPTPTFTPTPTRFPELLLTPEAPPTEETAYRLVPWSPDHAHNLALVMEAYHEAIRVDFFYKPTYLSTFKYAGLAYAEAGLRFPDDQRIDYWKLGEIAHLVTGSTWSNFNSALYQKLIIENLNTGKLSIAELPQWFQQYPSYADVIEIDPLTPLHGCLSSHIITINYGPVGGSGHASFWLLEQTDGFVTYPLYSNLGDPFTHRYSWHFADLTNDGIDDLIISAGSQNGSFIWVDAAIFDLSIIPPRKVEYDSDAIWFDAREIQTNVNEDGKIDLQVFSGAMGSCPAWIISSFSWNDQWLELVDIEIADDNPNFSHCTFIFNSKNGSRISEIEQKELTQWLSEKFDDIQPTGEDWRTDEPYLPDTQDEIRFIFAMNHAVLGKFDETHNYLERIINTPSSPQSQWIEPAKNFLSSYQSAKDVYKACMTTNSNCDLQFAVRQVASMLELDEFDEAIVQLMELGVPVVANGRFDFDLDQTPEHWFIVQHQPGEEYELWILAASDVRVKAMFVDTVDSLTPSLLLHKASYPPANDTFQFTIGNGAIYNFIRRLRDQEPYVVKLYAFEPYIPEQPPAEAALDRAIDDLLSGIDPQEILIRLQTLADNPDFQPNNRYYYYLGLAYELLGEEDNAVNAYLLAWQDCCDTWQFAEEIVTANPYAIMARAKLEPVP